MDDIKTTVYLELEGTLRHAVTNQTIEEIEALAQAERFIHLELDGEEISVQSGSIEYMRKGDHRPENKEPAPQ